MELQELLAFIDECYESDAENRQCSSCNEQQPCLHQRPYPTDIECCRETVPKKFQRPETKEIAALQSQAAALTLELDEIRQRRSHGSALALNTPSHWQTETDRQSRLRAAALKVNERLKAKVQNHRQLAKRLVNVLKRNPPDKVRHRSVATHLCG